MVYFIYIKKQSGQLKIKDFIIIKNLILINNNIFNNFGIKIIKITNYF